MRRLAVPLALGLALVTAAPGAAKQITGAEVCGTDRCLPVSGANELLDGTPAHAPARPEPFVRMRFHMEAPGAEDPPPAVELFLPGSGLTLSPDGRFWMRPLRLDDWRDAAAQVTPFPAAQLAAVRLDDESADTAPAPTTPAAAAPSGGRSDGGGAGGAPWWPWAGGGALAAALAALTLGARRRHGRSPAALG